MLERGSGSHRVVNRSVSQKAKFRGTNRPVSWICCIDFDGTERWVFFLVLFCYSAVSGDALRYNSRFDGFNSRLSRQQFPFPPLRELAGKGLIYLTFSRQKRRFIGENRENSRFHGNNREVAADSGAACNGAESALPRSRSTSPCRSRSDLHITG